MGKGQLLRNQELETKVLKFLSKKFVEFLLLFGLFGFCLFCRVVSGISGLSK